MIRMFRRPTQEFAFSYSVQLITYKSLQESYYFFPPSIFYRHGHCFFLYSYLLSVFKKIMNKITPDTYCGIYCGACSIAMHGETGRADGFAASLGSVPKEDLICGGCKSDTVYAGCSTCTLRRCAREKGIAHCVD